MQSFACLVAKYEKMAYTIAFRIMGNREEAEEVAQDAEGMQPMRTLGRNMAFMMKSFQLGKEQIGLPQKEPLIFTNFHR